MNTLFFESAKSQIESASFEASNLKNYMKHKYLEGKVKEIALNKVLDVVVKTSSDNLGFKV